MIGSISWRCAAALVIAATFAPATSVAQPTSETISMWVTRQPDAGGTFLLSAYSDSVTFDLALTAPDGTVFTSSDGRQLIDLGGLTLSELTSRFAGAWTINDDWNLPVGAATQHHQFTITAAQLSTFPQTPTVISPLENAIVPPRFSFVGGTSSTGWIVESGFPIEFIFPNPLKQIHALLAPGELQRTMELRASLNNFAVGRPVTALSADPTHEFHVRLIQQSQSELRTVTVVVPEPAAIALLGAAAISGGVVRRRFLTPRTASVSALGS